jgi:protein SCO1/2
MRAGLPRTLGIVALALAAVLLAFEGWQAWHASREPVAGLRGTPSDRNFAPITLTDQTGVGARLPPAGAAYTVIFFGYTHCPDVCPIGLSTIARADRALGHPARLGLAFVTVDPERDTPEALTTYTRSFDSRIVGFTGTPSQLQDLWTEFGVVVEPASREFVHGESIYLVDANGRILLEYPPDGSAADIASDARALLRL